MADAPVIVRKKLFEQVAHHLERRILDGHWKPGDLLPPERELQNLFGVGRPSIREALITLQRAGLVETSNGARSRVATPKAADLIGSMGSSVRQMLAAPDGPKQFQDARLFLETGLARHAARAATPADIERLAQALSDNAQAIGHRDRFIATDIAFHFLLAEISGNPIFVAVHDAISAWLLEQRVVTLESPGQERIAFEAHRAIYAAIEARDPDRAEAAMADHLNQLCDAYWQRRPAGRRAT